jgi:hypothetical protein
MLSTSLTASDAECNSLNTITSFDQCKLSSYSGLYDNQIADKVRPPNVDKTEVSGYSPETVMGQLNHVEHKVDYLFQKLPYCLS